MVKSSSTNQPFYDKKDSFSIYEDRMVLPKMDNKVIKFDDIYEIAFEKLDFTLYKTGKKSFYTTIFMKDGGNFKISIPLSGFYALRNYYQKGYKSTGKKETYAISVLSIGMLIVFLGALYIFVWRG